MAREIIAQAESVGENIQHLKDLQQARISACVLKDPELRKGADELIGKIRRIADTNDETEALLAFIGEMSGGKSMIINVLTGWPLLPSARVATSEAPVELRYGTQPSLEVVTFDENGRDKQLYCCSSLDDISLDIRKRLLQYALELDRKGIISSENLEYYYDLENQNEDEILEQVNDIYRVFQLMLIVLSASVGRGNALLEAEPLYAQVIEQQLDLLEGIFGVKVDQPYATRLKLPADILSSGLVLVDLPGLGSGNPLHEKITRTYMERADSYVLPFTPELRTEDSFSALSEIIKYEKMSSASKDSRFIVLLNQCDRLRRDTELKQTVDKIHPLMPQIEIPVIYPISAYYGEQRLVENGVKASATRWGRGYLALQDEDDVTEEEVALRLRKRYEKPFEYDDSRTGRRICSSTKDFMDGVVGGYAPRIRFLNALERVNVLMHAYSGYTKDLRVQLEAVRMLYLCGDELMKQLLGIIGDAVKECTSRLILKMNDIDDAIRQQHIVLQGEVAKALKAYEGGFGDADRTMREILDTESIRFEKDIFGHVLIDPEAFTKPNVDHNTPIYQALIKFFKTFNFKPYLVAGDALLQGALTKETAMYDAGLNDVENAFDQFIQDVKIRLGTAFDEFLRANEVQAGRELLDEYEKCYRSACDAILACLVTIGTDVIRDMKADTGFQDEMHVTAVNMATAINRVENYYHSHCVKYMESQVKISAWLGRHYVDIDAIKREVGRHFRTDAQNHNDLAQLDQVLCVGQQCHSNRIDNAVMKLLSGLSTKLVMDLGEEMPKVEQGLNGYFGSAKGNVASFFAMVQRLLNLICEDVDLFWTLPSMTDAMAFGKNQEFSCLMSESLEEQGAQVRELLKDTASKAKEYQEKCVCTDQTGTAESC